MEIRVLDDAGAAAREAARFLVGEGTRAIAARGRFSLALSGGSTPWRMLARMQPGDLPWERVEVFQVDERVAPAGGEERNLSHLRSSLVARVALPAQQVHAMPVEAEDLARAARGYASDLAAITGEPATLDVVHLGLGADGHTASLVPGDAVLAVRDTDVAMTAAPYQGRWRMTLTYPALDRARTILWLIAGADKAQMLRRLYEGDTSIPAGRVSRRQAVVFADRAAAASLPARVREAADHA